MSQPPDDFERGLVRLMPNLRAYAISLSRNRDMADDLVQDTMLKALANRHLFTEGTNLDAWLFTILRNSFMAGRRRAALRHEVSDPEMVLSRTIPIEDNPVRKMEACEILGLIERLQPHFKQPLKLLADGATYEEVAVEMCEQVGTIKSRAHRGRALLKSVEGT